MEPGVAITTNLVSALIGRQILGQAISDASFSIYGSVGSIFSYNTDVGDTLNKLDIKERVKTVDSLISHITECNNTITGCLESLHEIIILIREDLKQIDFKIKEHKQKYICNWRHLNCRKEIKNLTIHSTLLDTRLDYLIKALSIIRYNTDVNNMCSIKNFTQLKQIEN